MSDQERTQQIEQLQAVDENRLAYSLNQSQPADTNKQILNSLYSEGSHSRTNNPDFIKIQNIQNLSQEERATLNSIIRKLQHKVKIEFSSNQSTNNEGQHGYMPNFLGRMKSKGSEPSVSFEEDPKQILNKQKIEMLKNLLRKATEESKEKSQKLQQLESQIQDLKKYKAEHPQSEKRLYPQIQDTRDLHKEQNNQAWEQKKLELQEKYEIQVKQLRQREANMRKFYQSELSHLKNKIGSYEQQKQLQSRASQEKQHQYSTKRLELCAEIETKNREIVNLMEKNQALQLQLTIITKELEKSSLQNSKNQSRIAQLERKVQKLQQETEQGREKFEKELNEVKVKQAEKVVSYSNRLRSYQSQLRNYQEQRAKDAQSIKKLQKKVRQFQDHAAKAKLEMEEKQKKKSAILPEIEKQLKEYMKEFESLETQKENIYAKNEQLQRHIEAYQKTVEQLKQNRERLQKQIKDLALQKANLSRENTQLKNINAQIHRGKEVYAQQILQQKNIANLKDSRVKALEQKCEKLQKELSLKVEQAKKLEKKVQKDTSYQQQVRQSQILKKQNTSKIRLLEQEKQAIQSRMHKEMTSKIAYYEQELKKLKSEKQRWQAKFNEEKNKYNSFVGQSRKTQQGNQTQDKRSEEAKIVELKKLVKQYEIQLELKNHQFRMDKKKFEEILQTKQTEIAEKEVKIEQIIQKSERIQAESRNSAAKQTKQSRLSTFFELLKGFKTKMQPGQFNSLRSKISFMMS